MEMLVRAILDGNRNEAVASVKVLVDQGVGHGHIISAGVEAAMKQLDLKCTAEQFNLLEIMLCGRAVMGVMDELYPGGSPPEQTKGTIVLGSIEGDVHDLGKNIVKIILTAAGYRVVDCGKNCPPAVLVETAKREAAFAVGISGLITIVISKVREMKRNLRDAGLADVKVIAGGAALKQASPEDLCVDFVAESAFDGLHFLERLRGNE